MTNIFQQVNQSERHVSGILFERLDKARARFINGWRGGGVCAELTQQIQAPFGDDSYGFFGDDAKHSAHFAFIVV